MSRKVWCCGTRDGSVTVVCSGDSHALSRSFHYGCVKAEYDSVDGEWICQDCSSFGDRDRPGTANTDESWNSQKNAQIPEETQTQLPLDDALELDDDDDADQDDREHATGILEERYHPSDRYHQYLVSYDAFVDNAGAQQAAKEKWRLASDWHGSSEEKAFLEAQGAMVYHPSEEEIRAAMAPSSFEIADPAADEARNPYWPYLQTGYFSVVEKLLKDIADHRFDHTATQGVPEHFLKREMFEILACTPDKILRGICGKGLYRSKLTDVGLRSLLDRYRSLSVNRPCIYVLEFVDHKGRSPTVAEMRDFIAYAWRYLHPDGGPADIQLAIQVDEATGYLGPDERTARASGTRRCLPSSQSERELGVLLDALEIRVDQVVNEKNLGADDHLPFCLHDSGYTDNGTRRLVKEHERQQSSNKLMNLFQSLSAVYFKAMYTMRGDVVYLCHTKNSAGFAEIVFTMLAQSYTDTGIGFNGHPAGQNLISLSKYDSVERWQILQGEALYDGPFTANMAAEEVRVETYKQVLAQIEAAKLAREIAEKQEQVRQMRLNVTLRREIASVEDAIDRLQVT